MVIAKKALLRAAAGVRLEVSAETQGRDRKVTYKLSTHRPPQPRLFTDEAEALAAFDLEVKASMMDPVVAKLIERGMV